MENEDVPLIKHKGLPAVGRPLNRIVERRRVPNDLENELGQTDGMRYRAWSAVLKGVRGCVGTVRHVIGGVGVFAIPAPFCLEIVSYRRGKRKRVSHNGLSC